MHSDIFYFGTKSDKEAASNFEIFNLNSYGKIIHQTFG